MALLPMAAIAAISLSVSAVIFFREAIITSHPETFRKIKRLLAIDSDSDDSEEQLIFGSENESDTVSLDSDRSKTSGLEPNYTLRDAIMLENSLHESSPLLSNQLGTKPSFVDILHDTARSVCVAASTDISPRVVVDVATSAVTSINSVDRTESFELSTGINETTRIICEESTNNQISLQGFNNVSPSSYEKKDDEETSHPDFNKREFEICKNIDVSHGDSVLIEDLDVSQTNSKIANNQNQMIHRSNDKSSVVSSETSPLQASKSLFNQRKKIVKEILDEIVSDLLENSLMKELNSFKDSLIGETFENLQKERKVVPISLSFRENFRLPPAEGSEQSIEDRNEILEVIPSDVIEENENLSQDTNFESSSSTYENTNSYIRRESSPLGRPSTTLLDNLLYMNQEEDEIERLLTEGSAERREMLHRNVSTFLEPSIKKEESISSSTDSYFSNDRNLLEEIPLDQKQSDSKSLEEILDDLRSSRRLTPLQQSIRAEYEQDDVETPEQTVSFEYFLSPMPRSQLTELEKLPPTATSVDGSAHREPNVMHRMYDRSLNAPTLSYDPDLYRPPRRRRNTPSLQASTSEILERIRRSTESNPELLPATSLSARLMPWNNIGGSATQDRNSFGDESSAGSADNLLEPLLLRNLDEDETISMPRRHSAGLPRSLLSEMAQRRKSLERSAKRLGRRAGLVKKSRSPK